MAKTAVIIGATGLVGEQCLNELLNSVAYEKIIALTRKPVISKKAKLKNIVTDFEDLESIKEQLKADDVYCAMGTTIGKAGSKEAFRRVDYEIPLKVAEIAKQNGATKFILVSSLGADAKSSVFYSKVKGELEEALKKLRFDWLVVFRPSILLGDRKEVRRGEQVGRFVAEKFSFLFAGPFAKYKGTPVYLLAKKMIRVAQEKEPSSLEKIPLVRIIENEEILS